MHLSSNEARTSQGSFLDQAKSDTAHRPALLQFYDGLTLMSPTLLKQSIAECLDLGLKTELEVSKHLVMLYGVYSWKTRLL